MFYGRRRIDPGLVKNSPKRKWILDRNFQLNYTSYLTLAVAGSSLMAFGAVFYFLNQNFELFTSLAFDTHPGLVVHLEREVVWLKFFIAVCFVLIVLSTLFLTLRMTSKLIDPLVLMEKHMRKLTQGEWDIADLHNQETDFNELLSTYDYFYRSLKMMTESELNLLKKLHVDPANREAYAAWKTLLENKSKRLGTNFSGNLSGNFSGDKKSDLKLTTFEADASSAAASRLRRVS
jgi:hypothetical protein